MSQINQNTAALQELLEVVNNLPETVQLELQEKSVTPTKSVQEVIADEGYDGLGRVSVRAIPDEYIKPSGTMYITANNIYDVTDKASVEVYVPKTVPNLQEKTITENGTYSADAGYDGLGQVIVSVPTSGGGSGSTAEMVTVTIKFDKFVSMMGSNTTFYLFNGTDMVTTMDEGTVQVPKNSICYICCDDGGIQGSGSFDRLLSYDGGSVYEVYHIKGDVTFKVLD